jgi:hypothetical protein
MSTRAKGTFEVKGWDEKPFSEVEGGPKLTHASVSKALHGDIEAEGKLEYLMAYHADGTASFAGLERITGRIGDRSGSFVLEHSGSDDGSAADDTYTIVPGSGTGNLKGIRGEGRFYATRKEAQVPFTLDYDFE